MECATQDGNNTSLRVASFSCYLDTAKDNMVQKITSNSKRTRKPPYTPAFSFPQESIPKDGTQTSIFGADKYFEPGPEPGSENEGPVGLARMGLNPGPRTAPNKKKGNIGRRFFSGFFHIKLGACFGRKAVHINEGDDSEESRKSIEVFGSSGLRTTASKGDNNIVAANMERKLSMLTWDAIPKLGTNNRDHDMASEVNSDDLFEIEHISGTSISLKSQATAPDQDHVMSSTSAADHHSSVLTEYNDETSTVNSTKSRNGGLKETEKRRPGGLLGCKGHKAVVYVCNNKSSCGKGNKHEA